LRLGHNPEKWRAVFGKDSNRDNTRANVVESVSGGALFPDRAGSLFRILAAVAYLLAKVLLILVTTLSH